MFLVFKKAHTDIPHPFPSLCLEREYPQSSNKVAHSAIIQLSMSIAKVAWCHSQLSSQEVSEGATEIWGNWLYSWIWNYKRQCSWFPFPITIWIFVYQECTNPCSRSYKTRIMQTVVPELICKPKLYLSRLGNDISAHHTVFRRSMKSCPENPYPVAELLKFMCISLYSVSPFRASYCWWDHYIGKAYLLLRLLE